MVTEFDGLPCFADTVLVGDSEIRMCDNNTQKKLNIFLTRFCENYETARF